MSSTQAKSISATTGLNAQLVQFFINLSRPLRIAVKNFLISQKASLLIYKGTLAYNVSSCDIISDTLNKQRAVVEAIITPQKGLLSNIINAIPLNEGITADMLKEVSDFLNSLIKSMPVQIPAYLNFGTGDTDFFSGVKSYADLMEKLDEIEYRLASATSVSGHTTNLLTYVERQLETIDKWVIMLDAIDGEPLA